MPSPLTSGCPSEVPHLAQRTMTLAEYAHLCAAIPKKSRSTYLGRIGKFCDDAMVREMSLDNLTFEIVFDRLLAMAKAGEIGTETCHSWNNIAAHLRAVLEAACREELVDHNAAAGVRLPAADGPRPLFEVLAERFPVGLSRNEAPGVERPG